MGHAAITGYIDVAQLTLYAFWLFFAGLIYYLHREDKREGYPLEHERNIGTVVVQGFPEVPPPKAFLSSHEGIVYNPRYANDRRDVALQPSAFFPGAPYEPTGNPMIDGVGPASYADRQDKPELGLHGEPIIVPLRVAPENFIPKDSYDPRGYEVIGADNLVAGTVTEVWADRAEMLIRYLEVSVPGRVTTALLPTTLCRIAGEQRKVKVASILASQFLTVPALALPDQVTKLEEDKIVAYYAGGHLYAKPERMGPVL